MMKSLTLSETDGLTFWKAISTCFNCTQTIPTPTSIGGGARVPTGGGGKSWAWMRFIMYSLRAAVEASRTKALKSAPLKMVFDIVLTKYKNLVNPPFIYLSNF